ncbi:MAG: organic solvent tolerance ABC transporter substrate-binding protein [Candidatus Rokuibacteriota bacterium]|nr:MAG: organic solvent tolerance ABC transporter substrate-binding protein [Candidatus Rokubacteria bacterium]
MLYPGRGDRAMGKAFAAWLMVAGVVAAPATGPRETVETAVVRVVEVLQQPEATGPAQSERAAEIKRIARELFDFDEIARRALSRHWAGRTPVQHTEFVGLFTDLLERSYMNRIEAYAGERIVYTGEAVDGTFATVRSKVITQRRTELGIDYRMHLRGSRWQVYDVLIDGVSFVSTYRSQFDRVIQAESYGALVERLRKRSLDTAVVDRKKL